MLRDGYWLGGGAGSLVAGGWTARAACSARMTRPAAARMSAHPRIWIRVICSPGQSHRQGGQRWALRTRSTMLWLVRRVDQHEKGSETGAGASKSEDEQRRGGAGRGNGEGLEDSGDDHQDRCCGKAHRGRRVQRIGGGEQPGNEDGAGCVA